jgi:hypothetical protein
VGDTTPIAMKISQRAREKSGVREYCPPVVRLVTRWFDGTSPRVRETGVGEILRSHQEHSLPVMEKLHVWLGALAASVLTVILIFRQSTDAVFENQSLKVFQPVIIPGETTPEHLHSHDEVTICISGSTMRVHSSGVDGSTPVPACTPGQVSVIDFHELAGTLGPFESQPKFSEHGIDSMVR